MTLEASSQRMTYPVHTAVRDGKPVLVRRCRDCLVEKIISTEPRESEFHVKKRDPVTRTPVEWCPRCRVCERDYMRAWREANPTKAMEYNRRTHEKRMANPETATAFRVYQRELRRKQRARLSPAALEDLKRKNRERLRERYAADPSYWSKEARAARRAERQRARRVVERLRRGPVAAHRDTVDAEPFRRWLEAYAQRVGIEAGAELAFELNIHPRRVTGVLSREQANISLDIVDAALTSAAIEVDVVLNCDPTNSTTVWDIADLYGTSV